MGIQGLLPTLKSIIAPVHVRHYAGKKAAIDTYSWLHKAAYTCSKDICEGRPTDKFIDYCLHRVNLLRHYGVHPVLVFDGGLLPMKVDQEAKRARSRKEYLERAHEHERAGNHSAAYDCYKKAVDITPALAFSLIKVLKQEGVEYIVAPYEADAQMAYLALHNLVDVIITEDSDLIAYGCPRVLFKMDKSGQGDEFQLKDLANNKDLNFANFTKQMFLEMCIMAGCDYLPSLPGMGVRKAHGHIRRFKSYQKVIRHLRFSGSSISAQYEEQFQRALLTFCHQRVYDPVCQKMVHLNEVPDNVHFDLDFAGPDLPQNLVRAIAEGEVDPSTTFPFQKAITNVEPALKTLHSKSLTHCGTAKKPQELLVQKNILTKYFLSESQEAKKQFKAPRRDWCSKQVSKGSPGKADTLVSGEGLIDLLGVHPEGMDVFGTQLPDDDADSDPEASHNAHDNIHSDSQEKTSRITRVLQDDPFNDLKTIVGISEPLGWNAEYSLQSSVYQLLSPASTAGTLSLKARKKRKADEPHMKFSKYFLHPRVVHCQRVKPDATDTTRDIEQTNVDDDGCKREVMKKSMVSPCGGSFEKVQEAFSHLESKSQTNIDDSMNKRSQLTYASSKKWKQLSLLSNVSAEGGGSEVDNFSCNVSHVDQFSQVAQRSLNRFVEAIIPFRCASKGTRSSGLRVPMNLKTSTRKTKKVNQL